MIPQQAPPGANPDELLNQIRALLDEYLALGGDTPVAPEAEALASAIDGATGGTDQPDQGLDPGAGMPPEPQAPPKDFGTASSMALQDLKTGGPASQEADAAMQKKKKKQSGQGY